METLTIGRLAKKAAVNVETVRYYERRGLIAEPTRKPGSIHHAGYRQYPPDVVERIRFIKRAQELGFSLKEIDELLLLRVRAETNCAAVKQRAEDKIADIESKIADLRRMKRALGRISASCTGRGPTSECPILEAMEGKDV